jgi:hypothetical protein
MTGAAPPLALVVLLRGPADWLAPVLAAAAAVLVPGDEALLLDLGAPDSAAAQVRRFLARRGFGPGVAARLTVLGDVPVTAALAHAVAASQARHLIRIDESDLVLAAGVTRLRPLLAADPPAVRAGQQRWWIEPGLRLPPGPLPGARGLVLRRDRAEAGWPEAETPEAAWGLHRRLMAEGAPDLGTPLLRVPFAPATLPAMATPDLAAALIRDALFRPLAALGLGPEARRLLATLAWRERRRLFADPCDGALLRALYRGGTAARQAEAEARLTAARTLIAALARRLATLRAERDALSPDADALIRSHARLLAEIAAAGAPE